MQMQRILIVKGDQAWPWPSPFILRDTHGVQLINADLEQRLLNELPWHTSLRFEGSAPEHMYRDGLFMGSIV